MSTETGGPKHPESVVADTTHPPGLRLLNGGAIQESGIEDASPLVPDFGVDEETARTLQLSPWFAFVALRSERGTRFTSLGVKQIRRMLTNREPIVDVRGDTVGLQFIVADDDEDSQVLLKQVGESAPGYSVIRLQASSWRQ